MSSNSTTKVVEFTLDELEVQAHVCESALANVTHASHIVQAFPKKYVDFDLGSLLTAEAKIKVALKKLAAHCPKGCGSCPSQRAPYIQEDRALVAFASSIPFSLRLYLSDGRHRPPHPQPVVCRDSRGLSTQPISRTCKTFWVGRCLPHSGSTVCPVLLPNSAPVCLGPTASLMNYRPLSRPQFKIQGCNQTCGRRPRPIKLGLYKSRVPVCRKSCRNPLRSRPGAFADRDLRRRSLGAPALLS
jgi:hypothetical protein